MCAWEEIRSFSTYAGAGAGAGVYHGFEIEEKIGFWNAWML